MTGDLRYVRDDAELMTATVDGELLGMNVDRGLCYGFNAVATRVWELLAEPRSLGDLTDLLVGEFAVDPATCRDEVATLLDELVRERLVRASRAHA